LTSRNKRGQIYILMGLVLITILTVTLLASSRSSHPSPESVADIQMVLNMEVERAVLSSLAYASTREDISVAFSQRLRESLIKVEGGHSGAGLSPLLSEASSGDGVVSGQTEVQLELSGHGVSRRMTWDIMLEQTVTDKKMLSGPTPQLVTLQLTIDLFLKVNGASSPSTWRSSKLIYSSGEVECSLVKNFGNGTYVVDATLLAGEAYVDLVTVDNNSIKVETRVSIT